MIVRVAPRDLTEHGLRLMLSLGASVIVDPTAAAGCGCGAHTMTDQHLRQVAREARASLRAQVCPTHNEKLVEHGRVCRSCQRIECADPEGDWIADVAADKADRDRDALNAEADQDLEATPPTTGDA